MKIIDCVIGIMRTEVTERTEKKLIPGCTMDVEIILHDKHYHHYGVPVGNIYTGKLENSLMKPIISDLHIYQRICVNEILVVCRS